MRDFDTFYHYYIVFFKQKNMRKNIFTFYSDWERPAPCAIVTFLKVKKGALNQLL